MHEAYKHLLEQQNPVESSQALMESLDNAPISNMPVYKKFLIYYHYDSR